MGWRLAQFPFRLTEIDLSKTTRKGGGGLEVGPQYLVLYDGNLHLISFSEVWFGLTCHYPPGQYDPPGENCSRWQRVWKIEGQDELAAQLEPEYAASRKAQAISRGLRIKKQPVTEDTPVEAFNYVPDYSGIPRPEDEDEPF